MRLAGIIMLFVASVGAHVFSAMGLVVPAARWLVTGQALGGGLLLAASAIRGRLAWGLCLAALAALGYGLPPGFVLLADSVVLYGVIQGALLLLFARTLRPGHEPLVTMLARQVHGTLRPDVLLYTRQLTWAWTLFFAVQLILPALLALAGPAGWWRAVLHGASMPLVLVMFGVEAGVRRWRIRNFDHASIMDSVRAFNNRARG
ncbi:hypothetical protein ACM0P6_08615 [Komagataeibacter sucrofermentans]|uniref:Uncharacterized protein n=1 Tax=Komagataeibacter sucrofermentans TaxID=1053551 RepID=A0A318QS25_9PROT|nr:hypothetical protein [Komagataeibacter sucrofermentans]PYD80142.1 hypothetical protein CFR77_04035 [Komagataeibacter sucrofermentans]GBQ48386.1 hypothetical protein AA15973_1465 [Komagataeibacter sucrofermentans DSM 15973]